MNRNKELLRKQLELLAEQSGDAVGDDLVRLSSAMVDIYDRLERPAAGFVFRLILLLFAFFDFAVGILILLK